MHHRHHVVVVETDRGGAAAYARIMLEVDRQRGAAPGQGEHRLDEVGVDDVERSNGGVRHQLVFPQVELLAVEQFEDRGGRTQADPGDIARAAAHAGGFQHVDAGGFQGQLGGDLGEAEHVGQRRRNQQAGLAIELAELLAHLTDVALLAGGVEVVAAGPERGLDGGETEIDEGADGVADHLGALEGGGQRLDVVFGLDDFVGRRLQAHHALGHHFLGASGVARHGGEGDVLIDQPVDSEHAGVATGAIHDYGILSHLCCLQSS
ncbi:hypothetical protein D9M68_731080 [compost metagenome]